MFAFVEEMYWYALAAIGIFIFIRWNDGGPCWVLGRLILYAMPNERGRRRDQFGSCFCLVIVERSCFDTRRGSWRNWVGTFDVGTVSIGSQQHGAKPFPKSNQLIAYDWFGSMYADADIVFSGEINIKVLDWKKHRHVASWLHNKQNNGESNCRMGCDIAFVIFWC